jgi:Bacterial TniB protein
MSDESILEDKTLAILNGSLRDRLSWIQKEHWVNTQISNMAIQWMEYLLRSERTERPDCVHIMGSSGMGKTALLRNFAELHPVIESRDPLRNKRPVLRVIAKPEERSGAVAVGAASLRYMIMRAAWPGAKRLAAHCSVEECDETLKAQDVKLLLIDEGSFP